VTQNDALVEKLLGPLHLRLKAAQMAYAAYLNGERTFLYASILYGHNSAARDISLRYGFLLPEHLQDDLLKLIFHIDVWMTLWTDLKERTSPKPSDPFVFDNPVSFPRESVARLSEYFDQLCNSEAG
jgi:hypothetical protein